MRLCADMIGVVATAGLGGKKRLHDAGFIGGLIWDFSQSMGYHPTMIGAIL